MDEVTKIAMRNSIFARRRDKMSEQDKLLMRDFVREIARDYIAREQSDLDSRTKRMGALRSKYNIEATAAKLVNQLLNG